MSSSELEKNLQTNISTRLGQVISSNAKTLKEFSERLNIPYITLQQYLSGKRKLGIGILMNISIHLNISTDWLLTGEGEMYRRSGTIPTLEDFPEWLREWWAKADEKERGWLEVELRRLLR